MKYLKCKYNIHFNHSLHTETHTQTQEITNEIHSTQNTSVFKYKPNEFLLFTKIIQSDNHNKVKYVAHSIHFRINKTHSSQ